MILVIKLNVNFLFFGQKCPFVVATQSPSITMHALFWDTAIMTA